MSADPAMGEYFPEASSSEGASERNQNLPGLGGLYNSRNLQTYHYAGNNPLKYTEPSGQWIHVAAVIGIGAIAGGITSVLGGGNFWQGAFYGEIVAVASVVGGALGAGFVGDSVAWGAFAGYGLASAGINIYE